MERVGVSRSSDFKWIWLDLKELQNFEQLEKSGRLEKLTPDTKMCIHRIVEWGDLCGSKENVSRSGTLTTIRMTAVM